MIAHVNKVINDERVKVEILNLAFNPSPVSPVDNSQYENIERSIKQIFPEIMSTPNLVLGATDSRHFTSITSNIYRFSPFKISPENLTCFHVIDERVPRSEFENGIRFYRQLILNGSK